MAGAGALVALIVAYRRQKITEANSVHDRTRVFNERFTAIATQLGADQPAVRLAGVHAMAGLADDSGSRTGRPASTFSAPTCACPTIPTQATTLTPGRTDAYRANREVRHTVIRLIGAHLRAGAAVSWQGLTLDFTGCYLRRRRLRGARFSGGTVSFPAAPCSPAARSTSAAPGSPAA